MSAQKTVQGTPVTTVKISGKEYVTVAERSRVAHETCGENDIGGYEIIGENVFETNGRFFMTVQIRVNGKPYFGTSEIRFNAKAGTADATAPMECAETSAVGRALAFAGFGALDSIASADEVERATGQERHSNASAPAQAARPAPMQPQTRQASGTVQTGADTPATDRQIQSIGKLCIALKRPMVATDGLTFGAAKGIITELSAAYNDARQGVASNA